MTANCSVVNSSGVYGGRGASGKTLLKKGWLYRLVHNKKGLFLPRWSQCWLEIVQYAPPKDSNQPASYTLEIFEKRAASVLGSQKVLCFNLSGAFLLENPRFSFLEQLLRVPERHPFAFQLDCTAPKKTLVFATITSGDRERWIAHLQEAIQPNPPTKNEEQIRCFLPVLGDSSQIQLDNAIASTTSSDKIAFHRLARVTFAPFATDSIREADVATVWGVCGTPRSFDEKLAADLASARPSNREISVPTPQMIWKFYSDLLTCDWRDLPLKQTLLAKVCAALEAFSLATVASDPLLQNATWRGDSEQSTIFTKSLRYDSCISAVFSLPYHTLFDKESEIEQSHRLLYAQMHSQRHLLNSILQSTTPISVDLRCIVKIRGFFLTVTLSGTCHAGSDLRDATDVPQEIIRLIPCKERKLFFHSIGVTQVLHLSTTFDRNQQSLVDVSNFALDLDEFDFAQLDDSLLSFLPLQKSILITEAVAMYQRPSQLHSRYFIFLVIACHCVEELIEEYWRRLWFSGNFSFLASDRFAQIFAFILNEIQDCGFFESVLIRRIQSLFFAVGVPFQSSSDLPQPEAAHLRSMLLALYQKNCDPLRGNFLLFRILSLPYNSFSTAASCAVVNAEYWDCLSNALCNLLIEKTPQFSAESRRLVLHLALYYGGSYVGTFGRCKAAILLSSMDSVGEDFLLGWVKEQLNSDEFYSGVTLLIALRVFKLFVNELAEHCSESVKAICSNGIQQCCKFLGRLHTQTIFFQDKLADALMLGGDFDSALVALSECTQFYSVSPPSTGAAKSLLKIANCLLLRGDIEGSISNVEKALFLMQSQPKESLVDANLLLGKVCESQLVSLNTLTAIVTGRARYFLLQALQAYESIFDSKPPIRKDLIVKIFCQQCRFSLLLLALEDRQWLLMFLRQVKVESRAFAESIEYLVSELQRENSQATPRVLLEKCVALKNASNGQAANLNTLQLIVRCSGLEF